VTPLKRIAALWFRFRRLAGQPLGFEPLEIGAESLILLVARGDSYFSFLSRPFLFRLTLFFGDRRFLSMLKIFHVYQRTMPPKVPRRSLRGRVAYPNKMLTARWVPKRKKIDDPAGQTAMHVSAVMNSYSSKLNSREQSLETRTSGNELHPVVFIGCQNMERSSPWGRHLWLWPPQRS
jgi:hypothetical protein